MPPIMKRQPHTWVVRSKPREQYACSKDTFQSKGEALINCRGINQRDAKRRSEKKHAFPYRCTACGQWHISSQGKSKRAKYK